MSWRKNASELFLGLAILTNPELREALEHTEPVDYDKAIATVNSIYSYAKNDNDKYGDITPAILEFQMLNEKEREIAFFYLLGSALEVIEGGL